MSFHDLHHKVFRSCCPTPIGCAVGWPTSRRSFTAIGTTSFEVSSSGGRPGGHRAARGANSHWRPP